MTRKLTLEEFIKKSKLIHGNKYNYDKVIYVNCSTKVEIYCNSCKVYFLQRANGHLNGRGCEKCSYIIRGDLYRYNNNIFIKKANLIHKNKFNYDLIEYNNQFTKIKIKCLKCNEYFLQVPTNHLKGHGCSKCSKNYNYTTGEFINKAKTIHIKKYNYDLATYENTYTKIKIKCLKCNKIFNQTPDSHLRGQGCSNCFLSKGEEKIKNLLRKNNIEFKEQYKFLTQSEEIKRCRYDFFIPKINTIIEFQGQQHFKFVKYFHRTNDNYLKCWYRDILKKEFCLNNNINFVEIKYDEDIFFRLQIENIIL